MKKKSREATTIQLHRPYAQTMLAIVMFVGTTVFFAVKASTNERGLIINGIVHLDPGGADVFYAVFALLSAGITVMGIVGTLRLSAIKEFRILLEEGSITFPAGPLYRVAEVTVPLDRIVAVETQPAAKPLALVIREGEMGHVISGRWFPEGWSIRDVADLIIKEVRRTRAPSAGAEAAKASEAGE